MMDFEGETMKSGDKPSVAIAHVTAKTRDIGETTRFYCDLGLRKVMQNERMSILELRGGTHILFFKQSSEFKRPPSASFDLMVDDIVEFHARLKKMKVEVDSIREDRLSGHRMFQVKDPDRRAITIFSSHTEGRPI
jgi:catechol 2,3-dioxygenase-like lactoylglutathione lyase family enzyme